VYIEKASVIIVIFLLIIIGAVWHTAHIHVHYMQFNKLEEKGIKYSYVFLLLLTCCAYCYWQHQNRKMAKCGGRPRV